eukprot:TRINITY_DN4261_c0_g1_i13.p1 TRINITY_DN4261_c0_g1~~TRINITY_DN4261_c0_g1_i13.p1  ORF type:complete len:3428 (-),score=662.20 TRINITY_DN4261_c0_g1_i13:17-9130(-)
MPPSQQTDVGGPFVGLYISSTSRHSCVVMAAGRTLRCWGAGNSSQLGYNTTSDIGGSPGQMPPGDVPLAGAVVAASLGQSFTCALLVSGSVYCWGDSTFGQLGIGINTSAPSPSIPANLTGFTVEMLAAGAAHVCILSTAGNVLCWGDNSAGALGVGSGPAIGDQPDEMPPVLVATSGTAVYLVCGASHSCVLNSANQMQCWGLGTSGQLGDGNFVSSATPSSVVSFSQVPRRLFALGTATCAQYLTGELTCVGDNAKGQLGIENTSNQAAPLASPINLSSRVFAAYGGGEFACALLVDGEVSCWGSNQDGQLGLQTTIDIGGNPADMPPGRAPLWPVLASIYPPSPGDSITIVGSGFGTLASNLTVLLNATACSVGVVTPLHLVCTPTVTRGFFSVSVARSGFGTSNKIATEIGTPNISTLPPSVEVQALLVIDGTNFGSLASNAAVLINGLDCPIDSIQQLQITCYVPWMLPRVYSVLVSVVNITSAIRFVQVTGQFGLTAPLLRAGGSFNCIGVGSLGHLSCWGLNDFGQLGIGTTANVGDDPGEILQIVTNVGGPFLDVQLGLRFGCALTISRTLRCWGDGTSGQLGQGNTNSIGSVSGDMPPPNIALLGPVSAVDLGDAFACALLESGSIQCWGANSFGQLGQGNSGQLSSPSVVLNLSGFIVSGLAVGSNHTCILSAAASVTCWGRNTNGQLGIGSTGHIGDDPGEMPPVAVSLSNGVASISCGSSFSCAVLVNGQVQCWGSNQFGQLGSGSSGTNTGDIGGEMPPPIISLPTPTFKIFCGGDFMCAHDEFGQLRCWGSNSHGQLGVGSTLDASLPPLAAITLDLVHSVQAGVAHVCALLVNGHVACWGMGAGGQLAIGSTVDIGDSLSELPPSNAVLPPIVAAITPTSSIPYDPLATLTGPPLITVIGVGFGLPSELNPMVGSIACVTTFANDFQAICEIHNLDAGSFLVTLERTGYGFSNPGPNPLRITPILTSVSPGSVQPARALTLQGKAFGSQVADAAVYINGVQCPITQFQSNSIKCSVPWILPRSGYKVWLEITGSPSVTLPLTIGSEPAFLGVIAGTAALHSCFGVGPLGLLWCFGYNLDGQLGIGTTASVGALPSDMPVANATEIGGPFLAFVGGSSSLHSCVITVNSTLRCWGSNSDGQLGIDTLANVGDLPGQMPPIDAFIPNSVRFAALGRRFSCAVQVSGEIYCWGANNFGQLGFGNTSAAARPVLVTDLATLTAAGLSAGSEHICLLDTLASLYCWGSNTLGQLGLGDNSGSNAMIGDQPGEIPPTAVSVGAVLQVVCGSFYTCVLLGSDQISCWGDGSMGQLGSGTAISSLSPGSSLFFSTLLFSIKTTASTSCVLYELGTVTCWGSNTVGQLGLGDTTQRNSTLASTIPLGAPAHTLFGGQLHLCILSVDGDLKCWGGGSSGGAVLGVGLATSIGDDPNEMPPVSAILSPILMAISPSAAIAGSTALTLTGVGFGASQSNITVFVGPNTCAVVVFSGIHLECVPQNTFDGNFSVSVSRSGVGSSNALGPVEVLIPTQTRTRTRTLQIGFFSIDEAAPLILRENASVVITVNVTGTVTAPSLFCVIQPQNVSVTAVRLASRRFQCPLPPLISTSGPIETLSLSFQDAAQTNLSLNAISMILFRAPVLAAVDPSTTAATGGPAGATASPLSVLINGSDISLVGPDPIVEFRMQELPTTIIPCLSPVIQSGSVACTATFDLPGQYDAYLSLDGGRTFDVTSTPLSAQWLPVSVSELKFATTGASLLVQFDYETNSPVFPAGCASLFDAPSLALLGTASQCAWAIGDASLLVVQLGSSATATTSDSLTFTAASGIRAATLYPTTAVPALLAATVAIGSPLTPPEVQVRLTAPAAVSVCDNFTISAQESSGSVGRAWTSVSWSVSATQWPVSGYDVNATTLLQASVALETSLVLRLSSATLQAGVSYVFSVSLSNFLGGSQTADVMVAATALPIPFLVVPDNNLPLVVASTQNVLLGGRGLLSNCAPSSRLLYRWSQLSGPALSLDALTSVTRQTLIPAGTLQPGLNYTFRLSASVAGAPQLNASADLGISVAVQSAALAVSGADRVVGFNRTVSLRAINLDPDATLVAPVYAWDLETSASTNVASFSGQAVNLSTIAPGDYQIILQMADSASSFQLQTISRLVVVRAPQPLPTIFIEPFIGRANPSTPLVLRAASNDANLSLCWVSEGGELDLDDTTGLVLTSRRSSVLKIAGGYLQGGRSYRFSLFSAFGAELPSWCVGPSPPASLSGAAGVARADVTVPFNNIPYAGTLVALPGRIEDSLQICQWVTLTASDWTDDPEDLPLTYEFLVQSRVDPAAFFTSIASQLNSERTLVVCPLANATTRIQVKIRDRWAATATAETSIVLSSTSSITPASLFFVFNSTVFEGAVATGDTDVILTLLYAVSETLALTPGPENNILRQQILSELRQVLATTNLATADAREAFLVRAAQILERVSSDPIALDGATFNSFWSLVLDLGAALQAGAPSNDARAPFFAAVANAVEYSLDLLPSEQDYNISRIAADLVKLVQVQELLTHVCGQRAARFSASVVKARAFLVLREPLSNSILTSEPGSNDTISIFALPSSFSNSVGSAACVGAHLVTWAPNPFGETKARNSSIITDVATLRFTQLNGSEILVTQSDNINFTLPITRAPTPVNQSALSIPSNWQCVFYVPSNGTWSSAGCTRVSQNVSAIVCACSHLTDFAGEFKDAYQNATVPDITDITELANITHRLGTLIAAVSILALAGVMILSGHRWDLRAERQFFEAHPDQKTSAVLADDLDTKIINYASSAQEVELREMPGGISNAEALNHRTRFQRWLSVPVFSAAELPINEGSVPSPKPYSFWGRLWKEIQDGHLLVSYFFRDPQDPFTRPQRALCLSAIFLGEFAVNAAFTRSRDRTDILRTLIIGISTAVIIFPVAFLLPLLFRTFRGQDTLKIFRRPVPRWTRYIPYIISICFMIFFTYLVILYGLSFSKKSEVSWLISTVLSLMQENLIHEPIFGVFREGVRRFLLAVFNK